jgi:hypothetical protein
MKIQSFLQFACILVITFAITPCMGRVAQDAQGNTALMRACKDDSLENVKALLKNMSVNDINIENKEGKTALDLAQTSQIQIQEELRKKGATRGSHIKKVHAKKK